MKYIEKVKMSIDELNHYNDLLSIFDMEDMTDEELIERGANTQDSIPVLSVDFKNGARLYVDLCSGIHDYYDDIVFVSPNDKRLYNFEPDFVISDIEIEIDGDTYIVNIERV